MRTYAAIPINKKVMDDGVHIRRILISFTNVVREMYCGYPMEFFDGVKILAKDPYFGSSEASHKYLFDEDGYVLLNVDDTNPRKQMYDKKAPEIYNKRRYHENITIIKE